GHHAWHLPDDRGRRSSLRGHDSAVHARNAASATLSRNRGTQPPRACPGLRRDNENLIWKPDPCLFGLIPMDIVHCAFCKNSNPADAKFCNACGSALALQLCEACGAIDNVSATVCHKCGHAFAPRSGVAAPDEGETQNVTSAAQVDEPARPRRSPWKLFALLALIVAGALVIYPRVAGDEAQLPAIHAPVDVELGAGAKAE